MKLNNAQGELIAVWTDWQDFLVNYRGIRRDTSITWSGYKPFMLDDPVTSRDIARLAEERQYTFQIVEDGSIIQIHYEFATDGNSIVSAMLAYYGNKDQDTLGILVPPETIHDSRYSWESPLIPWLRVDFDPTAGRGVLHSPCHMHIGGFPDSRLMLNCLPNPKQFVEFVMALFHPNLYSQHRLHQDGSYKCADLHERINKPLIPLALQDVCKYLTHVYVPGHVI